MMEAFLQMGAAACIGYDEYVSTRFCEETFPPLFQRMLLPGATLASAFMPGVDPYTTDSQRGFVVKGTASRPANVVWKGQDVSIDLSGMQDSSFESQNPQRNWSAMGDAWTLGYFYPSQPTHGNRMLLIGPRMKPAVVSQTFCLSSAIMSIGFQYDFGALEGDPAETFQAILSEANHPENGVVLLSKNFGTSLDSGEAQYLDMPDERNHNWYYHTGWKTCAAEIPVQFLGKRVTLTFRTFNARKNDGACSVVLIDNIVFGRN
jgi:hypothetical protein